VVRYSSQWEGVETTYGTVTAEQAARWLISQDALDSDEFGQLPEAVRIEIEQHVAEAEV